MGQVIFEMKSQDVKIGSVKKDKKNSTEEKNQDTIKKSNSKKEYQGLKKTLYFCVGAKVYLTRNINPELGLFNSSPGVITDIVYKIGQDPQTHLPEFVLVEFDKYKGEKTNNKKLFPIVPITVRSDDNTSSRT